jgi:hypothetical protein
MDANSPVRQVGYKYNTGCVWVQSTLLLGWLFFLRAWRKDCMKQPKKGLIRWLDFLQPSGKAVLSAAAVAVGLSAAAGVWLFKLMIEGVHTLVLEVVGASLQPLGSWIIVLFPLLGGLAVGLIVHRFVGQEHHHGVAGVMEAVALAGGRQTVVPRGDTPIQPGDKLAVVLKCTLRSQMVALCAQGEADA